jgi:hypothetical protein
MLDQEKLLSLIHYDPETGIMTWLPKKVVCRWHKTWNTIHAGKQLTNIGSGGYLQACIIIDGIQKGYLLHRLAWLYVYGEFPEGPLDHINRIKTDNRICNLRIANAALNGHNVELNSKNRSGVKGVSWSKESKKWRAVLVYYGQYIHLGLFANMEDAKNAYVAASIQTVKKFSIHSNGHEDDQNEFFSCYY